MSDNGFLYEMHMHTAEVSPCAESSAREQVRFYHARGFDGICITDHFFNGNNTYILRGLPWKDRVREFCKGYEAALDEGEKLGISVFFGWEYPIDGTDLLTYGLSPEWLLQRPEIMEWEPHLYGDHVHEHGGFVVHAHPFREAWYIPMIRLMPRQVDGVEILNANRTDFENEAARDYAERYGLLVSGGSDNHTAEKQARLCALRSSTKLHSIEEVIAQIRDRKMEIVTLEGGLPK